MMQKYFNPFSRIPISWILVQSQVLNNKMTQVNQF